MSYTFQTVEWTRISREPKTDVYGDQTYKRAKKIKARKQSHNRLMFLNDGRELYVRNIYYVDPSIVSDILKIERLDLIDNEVVEDIYVMNDLFNKPKMVRIITR